MKHTKLLIGIAAFLVVMLVLLAVVGIGMLFVSGGPGTVVKKVTSAVDNGNLEKASQYVVESRAHELKEIRPGSEIRMLLEKTLEERRNRT